MRKRRIDPRHAAILEALKLSPALAVVKSYLTQSCGYPVVKVFLETPALGLELIGSEYANVVGKQNLSRFKAVERAIYRKLKTKREYMWYYPDGPHGKRGQAMFEIFLKPYRKRFPGSYNRPRHVLKEFT